MDREEYTKHVTTSHVPQTDFKETAVFVGQTNTTKTDADQLPTARDRTLVFLEPNVMNEDQIFSPAVKESLRTLLHYDVALAKRISARLLCRALVEKFEDDTVITRSFYAQTSQVFMRNEISLKLSFR